MNTTNIKTSKASKTIKVQIKHNMDKIKNKKNINIKPNIIITKTQKTNRTHTTNRKYKHMKTIKKKCKHLNFENITFLNVLGEMDFRFDFGVENYVFQH